MILRSCFLDMSKTVNFQLIPMVKYGATMRLVDVRVGGI